MTELIKAVLQARKNSYAKYSHFTVGAALLTQDGKIYLGTNIENASYPVGICAERAAFAAALTAGERNFRAIALIGGSAEKEIPEEYCLPCGMCRQFMAEFCTEEFQIISVKSEKDYRIFSFGEIMPFCFQLKQ